MLRAQVRFDRWMERKPSCFVVLTVRTQAEAGWLFLWATRLEFDHPTSGERRVVVAEPPARFKQFVDKALSRPGKGA